MRSLLTSVYAFALAVGTASAQCQGNNVLRALRNPDLGDGPSRFCSAYLLQTATVSQVTTVPSFTTTTTTLPDAQTSVTESSTVTETITSTIRTTLPATTTTTSTTTTRTSTSLTYNFRKRATTLPNGMPAQLATYPPERISTGCSCLLGGVPTTTVVSVETAVSGSTSTSVAGPTSTATQTFTTVVTSSTSTSTTTTAPPPGTATLTVTSTASASTTTRAPPRCGLPRGGAPSAPGGTGQYTFGSFPTRAGCQASCDANPICKCIVYADVSTICSLHTKYCYEIYTAGTALLYFDKFCPV